MPPDEQLLPGLITKTQSGFFTVETESGPLVCKLRGRLKRGQPIGDLAAIGDRVLVHKLEPGRGTIEKVEPRQRMLSRQAPTPRGVYQQIIIANPDQAILVFACTQPAPRLRMLDRFLVIAEKQQVPPLIVANKIDLISEKVAQELFGHYAHIGYPILFTSAKTGKGVPALREALAGKISVFTGPSGAGKSSLLNAIQPGLGLSVREVSQTTSKGRHTTVRSAMFPLESGGYVADTPGLKALALWDIEAEELDAYFPELRALVKDCQFSDCTHLHEPGCAVLAAIQQGRVHPERYESYMRMRLGED